ncbi:MAG: hypothetical protein O3A00_15475 [Planctomycetota bacterium]|nr:hypothetical protein [Planctomycetota bacterium]
MPKSSEHAADADAGLIRTVLGYLNFSSGASDPQFLQGLNRVYEDFGIERTPRELAAFLRDQLRGLSKSLDVFADSSQAEAVIRLTLEKLMPAYREHHRDLLFHLADVQFHQPLFIGRAFEAVLSQGGPWDETTRIVDAAIDQLNDFLGWRPLAVLENDNQMQPYDHERVRPMPLYIKGVGAVAGPYKRLVECTLEFLQKMSADVLSEAHFHLEQLEEFAVDVRAHDHTHPANKRANYMFGEWDPHQIDVKGRYTRFIIRKIILDAMFDWMDCNAELPTEELLHDASAVLCGTMLMASSVSGSGPDTHDSTISLMALLPKIVHQRDSFYSRLLATAQGKRAKRLKAAAEATQQPFGHVRLHLNMHLASYGAHQFQRRHLAQFYARLGYPDAARESASVIPSTSTRFETELLWRITISRNDLDVGRLDQAVARIDEVSDLIHRGIECGALVDPWNILGFQGQFPVFAAREDVVPDHRVEVLLDVVENLFGLLTHALIEAAAQGNDAVRLRVDGKFREIAEEWDRYATTTVEDIPKVFGEQSWKSAVQVATALKEWCDAGEAAGDISFWQKHVQGFQSAKAYAQVVEALLKRRDHVAAMALLMQWLSCGEDVGLESGSHSIHLQLVHWLLVVTNPENIADGNYDTWATVRRLFDYLEANADDYWNVPTLSQLSNGAATSDDQELAGELDEPFEDEDEDDLFEAAYESVTYRDSAEDGVVGDTLDDGYTPGTTEFEVLNREVEPRLKFLTTLAQLWQIAASRLTGQAKRDLTDSDKKLARQQAETIEGWRNHIRTVRRDLRQLADNVAEHGVNSNSGDIDANLEYDIQIQTKYFILHTTANTYVECLNAERSLNACLADAAIGNLSPDEASVREVVRAVFQRDDAKVRESLPTLASRLKKQSLLYVPFDNGGTPKRVFNARSLLAMIRFLLVHLPRLGLLRETYQILLLAYHMERHSRPVGGMAVTEFDRLLHLAVKNSVEFVVESARASEDAADSSSEIRLLDLISTLLDPYVELWRTHSSTMRLSMAEELRDEEYADDVKDFIQNYGHDLFHAKTLSLGNVRTILHSGIAEFLDFLGENDDPLHPSKLIRDMHSGELEEERAVEILEVVYETVVEKFDRFIEYNTTTTQSDYGNQFFCLLDFLRVETEYERDNWNLAPERIAHEVLTELGQTSAALEWEEQLGEKTEESANRHIERLKKLEKNYGIGMPSVADHLLERFTKPLAVNRMVALIPKAHSDAREGVPSAAFKAMHAEIEAYLNSTTGSGIDVPPWLRVLERELMRIEAPAPVRFAETESRSEYPTRLVSCKELLEEIETLDQPIDDADS